MIDSDLLSILVCPETHKPVQLAEGSLIEKINEGITKGSLKNKAGEKVAEKIEAGLLREDGEILYPIRDNIPVMLIDEGILVNAS